MRRYPCTSTLIGLLLLAAGTAPAALTYDADTGAAGAQDGAGSGWNTSNANFWDDATDVLWPNSTSDVAIFGAGSGVAGSVTVGTVTANGLTFSAPGSGSYTLAGGTITLGGTTPTIAVADGVSSTIASVISGTTLTKAGAGTLTLTGAGAYTGATVISGGTLKLESPAYRYYRFLVSTVNGGGANGLQMSELAFYASGFNNLNGTRVFPTGNFGDGGSYLDAGIAGLYDNNTSTKMYAGTPMPRFVTFDFGTPKAFTGYAWSTANDSTPARNPSNWTVLGSVDNSTWVTLDTKTGAGATPTATFTWAAGWPLSILPPTTAVQLAGGATLDLNGRCQIVASLADSGGGGGSIINSASATPVSLLINSASGSTTFSGTISDSGSANAVSLTKYGAGIQVLAGANTYTGDTTVPMISTGTASTRSLVLANAGGAAIRGNLVIGDTTTAAGTTRVEAAQPNQFGPNTVVYFRAANAAPCCYFNIEADQTVAGLSSTATAGNGAIEINPYLDNTVYGNRTLMIDVASGSSYSYAGPIRNTDGGTSGDVLGIVKTGPGSQTLSAAGKVTYTGATAVNNGTLTLQDTTGFASAVSVGASGTLNLTRTVSGFASRSAIAGNAITGSGIIDVNNAGSGLTGGWVIANTAQAMNFTGTLNINSGVFGTDGAGGAGVIAGSATVNVAAGGVFVNHSSASVTIGGLNGAGEVTPAQSGNGTYGLTVGAGDKSGAFAGIIHGNNTTGVTDGSAEAGFLALTKTGTGTQTLTGANTFSGTPSIGASVFINQGVLATDNIQLSGTASGLGRSGSIALLGGTLRYTGSGGTTDRRIELGTANGALDASGAGALLLTGSNGGAGQSGSRTLTLTGTSTAANTITFALDQSGFGGGTLSVVKSGAGTWILGGASAYTGTTTINGGILRADNATALGNSGAIVFGSGGTLQWTANSAGQDWSARFRNGTAPVALDTGGQDVTFSTALDSSNTNGLVKLGAGTLQFSGVSTYGGATVINGGTLKLGVTGYRYYKFQVDATQGGGIVQLSELAFYASGTNNLTGVRVLPTGYSGGGTWNANEDPAKTYDNNTGTKWCDTAAAMPQFLTFDFGTPKVLTGYDWATANDETPARNPKNWTILGSANNSTWTTLATRAGSGSVPVSTFTYATGWPLPGIYCLPAATPVLIAGGAALDLNGNNQAIASLADSGAGGGSVINSAAATPVVLTLNATAGSTTFSGAISDGGSANAISLVKSGAATQVLVGNNTYAGATTLNAGLLVLAGSGALPAGGNVILAGGTLDASNFGHAAGTLDLNGAASLAFGPGSWLTFADSSTMDWGSATLNVTGAGFGVSGPSQLRFGTSVNGLTPAQVASIVLNGEPARLNADGYVNYVGCQGTLVVVK